MWDLVPGPGKETQSPAVEGAESQPLNQEGSSLFFFFNKLKVYGNPASTGKSIGAIWVGSTWKRE